MLWWGLGFLLSALIFLLSWFLEILSFGRFLLSAWRVLMRFRVPIDCSNVLASTIHWDFECWKVSFKCSDGVLRFLLSSLMFLLPWFAEILNFGGFLLSSLTGSDGFKVPIECFNGFWWGLMFLLSALMFLLPWFTEILSFGGYLLR